MDRMVSVYGAADVLLHPGTERAKWSGSSSYTDTGPA